MIYERIRRETGWTYREISGLSFSQMRNVLLGGAEPAPKIAGARAMKAVLERFKRGEFRG